MGIHNLKGAKFLESLGFSRVILSREAKLEDIKHIKENTKLEIEYFVQGALCVAFSGNCYLSSLKNGNSGNRGKCLQLCRLPYTAIANNKEIRKGYFLSPSDLCLIENLEMLSKAGITSFKIEGRLKRASYIAQTVKSYRKAIDYLEENKKLDFKKEIEEIKAIFSRGNLTQMPI
jgi:putative protease